MAADSTLLQGQLIKDPSLEEKNVEGLLRGFLKALQTEQHAVPGGMTSAILPEEEAPVRTQAN